jgi:hypothetical protein
VNLSTLEPGNHANSPKQAFPSTQNGAAEAEDGEDAEVSLRRWRGTDQQIWSDDSFFPFCFPLVFLRWWWSGLYLQDGLLPHPLEVRIVTLAHGRGQRGRSRGRPRGDRGSVLQFIGRHGSAFFLIDEWDGDRWEVHINEEKRGRKEKRRREQEKRGGEERRREEEERGGDGRGRAPAALLVYEVYAVKYGFTFKGPCIE